MADGPRTRVAPEDEVYHDDQAPQEPDGVPSSKDVRKSTHSTGLVLQWRERSQMQVLTQRPAINARTSVTYPL